MVWGQQSGCGAMRLVWVEREWGVEHVGLVCGLFGAGRCGSGHGVRTTRLESASCHIRVGSVWVEHGRFGHRERAVSMRCRKRENGVSAAVGGVGQCVWCGSSENGVWDNVRLVCGLFGAGRGGLVHGVRTTRLESASCVRSS